MVQHALQIKTAYQPSLVVVKGKTEYDTQLQQLSTVAWHIAYTALWNAKDFSQAEKEKAIQFIQTFLQSKMSPLKAYNELIQRILLARLYILTHPGTYAPLPSLWLSPENKNGFAGTAKWYDAVQVARCSLPGYKIQLKAFAEAVLEIVESQNANDFHYWRSYFIRHNCQGLLNLFLSTIANYLHRQHTV